MTAVKGPVYEFDLGHFLFDKKAEFFFYQLDITKPHFFIDRRKTITTGERTASGGFIINDLVFELFHIFITEWDRAHIHRLCHSGKCHRFVPIPVSAGVSCVIAETFARIFYRNAINIGLPIIECPAAAKGIEAGDEVEVDFDTGVITFQGQPFPEFMQKIIKAEGLVNYINQK